MATTLFDYYTSQGKALPSVQERGQLYQQYGLGDAASYGGTADQNVALLNKLSAAPATGTLPYNSAGGIGSKDVAGPLPASTMTSGQSPLNVLPYSAPPIPSLQELMAQYNNPSTEQTAAQSQQNDILKGIEGLLTKQGSEAATKAQYEQQAGIPDMSKQLNEINNQIRDITGQAFSAQQTSEGRQAPTFAITGEQAQIQRQLSARTFGLAAASQAIQGNIALAQDNVQRALDAEFGGLQSRIDYQKTLLQLNQDRLSAADKKKADTLQVALNERQRILDNAKEDKDSILALAIAAMKNYPNDPAALYAAQQALKVGDLNTAFGLVGQYQADPLAIAQSIADLEYRRSLAKPGGGGGGAGGGGATASAAEYGTPQYYSELFATSKGGRPLTGDQSLPLTKAAIVLNQIGELSAQISTTTTDPLLGILRDNNPYDVKARLIQAQLRATVPNLARGVYGEVGVLTDNDIANYIQTLPNIKTPKEANSLILAMTLDTIRSSFEAYLESYANSGRDVSGFSKQYEALVSKIKQIKVDAGITESSANTVDTYKKYRSELQPGEILVLRNGTPYAIQKSEFNLATDKLPPGPMNVQ